MIKFENVDTRSLMMMLAEYTEKFTRLFRIYKRTQPGRGYLRCKYTIEAIMNALNKRRGIAESEKQKHIRKYELVCLSGL